MITVKLQGGLGNQLFQYATARALAEQHGSAVAFDLSSFQEAAARPDITPRRYELDAFAIAPTQPSLLDGLARDAGPVFLKKIGQKLRNITTYQERALGYDPMIGQKTTANTYLVGYFQSERYFENIRDVLRDELTFLSAPDYVLLPKAPNLVSLHVRRGDYVTSPKSSALHGLCSLEYYQKAAAYLAERLGEITIAVFSDDQPWARAHLNLPHPVIFVERHAADESYRDMQLMSQCDHHIIANSSFSWWGAWLNPSPDKLVVAPRNWLAHAEDPGTSANRTPSGWARM